MVSNTAFHGNGSGSIPGPGMVHLWICVLLNVVAPRRSDGTLNRGLVCVAHQTWTIKIPTALRGLGGVIGCASDSRPMGSEFESSRSRRGVTESVADGLAAQNPAYFAKRRRWTEGANVHRETQQIPIVIYV